MHSIYQNPNVQVAWEKVKNDIKNIHNDFSNEQLIEYVELLKTNQIVLVAHYYTHANVQKLAELSGGFVGDSLAMAKFAQKSDAQKIIVAGVRFMAETVKILCVKKTIYSLSLESECSLDLSCPANEFEQWIKKYPDREVVVYVNTSIAVKALADYVVTSSIAKNMISKLHSEKKKILWGPDKHLGDYLQKVTNADLISWDGACIVHEEFNKNEMTQLKLLHPNAELIAHPESPKEVLDLADEIGSTSYLIEVAQKSEKNTFIVATDSGIIYQMQKLMPDKTFIEAFNQNSINCKSCAKCPWMALNQINQIKNIIQTNANQIEVDETLRLKAKVGLDRMVTF